ncbi:hypothetical protein L210DRAFT_3531151 [Boletus edulis BED1]|uniref:Uncharacterized protein n=1 Tax=Boletus edulis BED1 TaxID=1328754 RepID=A0AAD4C094_BOLED|nr:hypothetical protein L210DRAFT_3531151 [Boletus edulis BED1]
MYVVLVIVKPEQAAERPCLLLPILLRQHSRSRRVNGFHRRAGSQTWCLKRRFRMPGIFGLDHNGSRDKESPTDSPTRSLRSEAASQISSRTSCMVQIHMTLSFHSPHSFRRTNCASSRSSLAFTLRPTSMVSAETSPCSNTCPALSNTQPTFSNSSRNVSGMRMSCRSQ